jgi:4-amino-4-deoxy-L-arabinose transferase-like glycosyltransferase
MIDILFMNNDKLKLYSPLIVFFLSLIFLGWGIWDYPLMDLDEPRYPEAAREMIENSQYWIPMTNGELLFEKPILIYWSIILAFKSFGVNEFASRLPSVIAGALTVTTAFVFGRFFKIGVFTSLILATAVEFFVISRLSIPELLLNFFTMTSLAIYFLISQKLISKKYFYLMITLMSFGFLAKGPLAFFVPGLVIVSFSFLEHFLKIQSLKQKIDLILENKKLIFLSFLIFLFVGCSWYIIAHFVTDGGFTKQFFITENFQRFTSTLTGHKHAWWFYIAVAVVGFLPWSLFLPAYLLNLKANLSPNSSNFRLKIFCWTWVLSNIGFFSFSSTKLFNYIFSVFFPLAVLAALWFYEERKSKNFKVFISSILFVIIISVFLGLFINGNFDYFIQKEDFLNNYLNKTLVYVLSGLILIFSIAGIIFSRLKKIKTFFFILCLCFAAGEIFSVYGLIKPLAVYKVGGIKTFASQIPNGAKVYRFKIDRPSLSFYAKKYTESIGRKAFDQKILSGEKFCILAKNDKIKLIESTKKLKTFSIDDKYIYACTMN